MLFFCYLCANEVLTYMRYTLFFLFWFLPLFHVHTFAQTELDKYVKGLEGAWTKTELSQAHTAKEVKYLSDEEKKVVLLTNLVRMNPKKFWETIGSAYCKDKPTNKWIQSLEKDLLEAPKAPLLHPSTKLSEVAKVHALDMGKTGKKGHNSSDGSTSPMRAKKYKTPPFGENCDYGFNDALNIVMHLLIDENVESLGHRKNILELSYIRIGVSIEAHKEWKYNCVQDMSSFLDTVELEELEKQIEAKWRKSDWEQANVASKTANLSKIEKKCVQYINLLRTNPAKFWETFGEVYFEATNQSNVALKTHLKGLEALPALQPSDKMNSVAQYEAENQNKLTYSKRIEKFGVRGASGEVPMYGTDNALFMLMACLSRQDMDLKPYFLAPRNKVVGIGIRDYKLYGHLFVASFSTQVE